MEAYTGQDIIKTDDRVLSALADGDCAIITYPNELHGMKNGKGGNSMATHNEQGKIAELELRIIKGSPDDKYLNSKVIAWENHSPDFTPSTFELTKVVSVDNGLTNEVTTISFGFPVRKVDTKTNTDGDVDQVISIYRFRGGVSNRALS